jgi:predicted Rossmann fold flavoprotein
MNQVIIIGAGPAGLMAAGQAALAGAQVVVLEKMPKPALKLNITGSGRCNITNAIPIVEFEKHIRTNFRFLRHSLFSFSNHDLIDFLGQLGIKVVKKSNGKIFPISERAEDVSEALVNWLERLGVKIVTGFAVKKLVYKENRFICINSSGAAYDADKVIIATGGASFPKTGSTGDGYHLARRLGHSIVAVRAGLVPIEIFEDIAHLQGLSLSDIKASVWVDGKKIADKVGDMIFAHFGLSGPLILSLSRGIVDALAKKSKVKITIDLLPLLDVQELDQKLIYELSQNPKQKMKTILKVMMPKRLVDMCLAHAKINPEILASQINSKERKQLRVFLKEAAFTVKATRPITESIITAGGVETKEVDPKTMGSKLVNGLYFAGELLDVDADTGGFNLQIAFSTGWLAGKYAAIPFRGESFDPRNS